MHDERPVGPLLPFLLADAEPAVDPVLDVVVGGVDGRDVVRIVVVGRGLVLELPDQQAKLDRQVGPQFPGPAFEILDGAGRP